MITQEYLKSILKYDPEDGTFVRIKSRRTDKVGVVQGYTTQSGYISIGINRKGCLAHRMAFLYMTGYIPPEVDHINRRKDDNRWCNLRAATRVQNCANGSLSINNTSGSRGVDWKKDAQLWEARIGVGGKRVHLGYFHSTQDAINAREAAHLAMHGEFSPT